MDTAKCAALLLAVELGSLSAAAERLGYTVSGMSRMILSLEDELGFRLLNRSRAGVEPTRECALLLGAMRELTRWGESCRQLAAQVRGLETGRVRVGMSYPAYYPVLTEAVTGFSGEHPGVEIELVEGTSSVLSGMLERHEADFCIMSRRSGAHAWTPLTSDSLAVWLPANHPLASRESYPAAELANEAYIDISPGEETDNSRFLAERGISVRRRASTSDIYGALSLVGAGLGVALVNTLLAKDVDNSGRTVLLPIDPPYTVEIGAAYQPRGEQSPAAGRFTDYALSRLLAGARK